MDTTTPIEMDERPSVPRRRRRILGLTEENRGEANVFMAAFQEFMGMDPDVDIHMASFGNLAEPVAAIQDRARQAGRPHARPVAFHRISGMPMKDALIDHFSRHGVPTTAPDGVPVAMMTPLGFSATRRAIATTVPVFVPYEEPELSVVVESIISIIKDVDPDLVVVGSLLTPGITACYHVNVKFVCLSPNSIKEFAASVQPNAAVLWKYPAMSTGYPYPIPWRLLPANIFLTLYCIYKYLSDPIRRGVARQLLGRTGVELRTMVDLFTGGGGGQSVGPKILVSSWAELDFDLGTIPDHVVPCGPIVQVSRAVAEAEPELEAWMSRGPVIYVNLGSMCMLTEDRAVGLARGLRDFVRGDPAAERMQILWKIKKQGEYDVGPGSRLYDVLGPSIESGSVRIVDWLVTEPMAILQSGHVRCSVHHGGANSYNEAVVAGVPHLVLPQWADTYEYASRVEFLGIGRTGNPKSKPLWTPGEISTALHDVVLGEHHSNILANARELATLCNSRGAGAENAARHIMNMCHET